MKTLQLLLISTLIAFAMSGGVHRIAQSRWNIPNSGQTTELSFYFMLDNALPYTSTNYQKSILRVGLPSTLSFTVGTTGCFAWEVGTTLTAPTATSSQTAGTVVVATNDIYVTFAAALSANKAYGLRLVGTGTPAAGSFAPVLMATYAGKAAAAYTGPYIDYNPVFDSVFVSAAASTVTLAAARVADASGCTSCNSHNQNPGETQVITWTLSSFSLTAGKHIYVPYNIVLTFAAPWKMADDTTYYDNWSFATTCTNKQFGVSSTVNGTTVTPTMKTKTPTCTQTSSNTDGTVLTIAVTDTADSMMPANFTNWVVSFDISVTNPSNWLGQAASVTAMVVNANNGMVHAKTTSALSASALTVITDTALVKATILATTATGDCTPYIAWGINPLLQANADAGVTIWQEVFCGVPTTLQASGLWGNCYNAINANTHAGDTVVAYYPPRVVNALELNWKMPYTVPSDSTKVQLKCMTSGLNAVANWGMYQSSIVTNVGTGNCYYSNTAGSTSSGSEAVNYHSINCFDVGTITASTDTLLFAFQFYITNEGKSWTAASGIVAKTNGHDFVCTLLVTNQQRSSATATTATTWYTSTVTLPINGGSSATYFKYETFIWQDAQKGETIVQETATGGTQWEMKASSGNWGDLAAPTHQLGGSFSTDSTTNQYMKGGSTKASPTVYLFFYPSDTSTTITCTTGGSTCGGTGGVPLYRKWPFAWTLLISGFSTWKLQTVWYGKETYLTKTTGTLVSSWAETLWASGGPANGHAGGGVTWAHSTATTNKLISTTSNLGFLSSESAAQAIAQATTAKAKAATVYTSATTQLFQWNFVAKADWGGAGASVEDFHVLHTVAYLVNRDADKAITLNKFAYSEIWANTAIDYLTAFRGRGHQGENNQRLCQHYWQLTTNETSTPALDIRMMIHTYISISDTKPATYTNSANPVTVGWPIWIECTDGTACTAVEQNNGQYLWNAVKIYIAAISTSGATNQGTWVGTFMPTAQPFFKASGDNAVYNLMDITAGSTDCYYFGCLHNKCVSPGANYEYPKTASTSVYINGVHGSATMTQAEAVTWKNPKQGYGLQKWRQTSLLTCKISDSAVTAANVIIVPFKNQNFAAAAPIDFSTTVVDQNNLNLLSQWATGLGTGSVQSQIVVFGSDYNLEQLIYYYVPLGTALTQANSFMLPATVVTTSLLPFTAATNIVSVLATATNWDITVASNGLIVGKAGVEATMTIVSAGTSVWTVAQQLTEFCGSYDYLLGANIGSVLDGTTTCLRLALPTVSTSDTSTLQYECFFCPGKASGATHTYTLKTFNLPVTTTGKITGISYIQTQGAGLIQFILPTGVSNTEQKGAAVTECGMTPRAGTLYKTFAGQELTWSLTAGNPMTSGYTLRWEKLSTSTSGNTIVGTAGSTSIKLFCAGTEITGTLGYTQSTTQVRVTIPTSTTNNANNVALCASGSQLTLSVRQWTTSSSDSVGAVTGVCYSTYTTTDSGNKYQAHDAASDTDTAARAVSTVGWTFTQTATLTQTKLTTTANFQPNALQSYGKFTFAPTIGSSTYLYKQDSTLAFVFGNAAFGTTGMCRVMASGGASYSEAVASCTVSSATITVVMNQDAAAASFQVEVLNAGTGWTWSTDTVTGTLTNYAAAVQSMATTTMASTVGALPTTNNKTATIVLAKTYKYTMDVGTFNFTCTLGLTGNTWTANEYALVQFPAYYRADLGDGVVCTLLTSTGTTEQLWCQMLWDWTLKVWGPAANSQVKGTAFNLIVSGVNMNNAITTAQSIQVGFSNSSGALTALPFTEFGQATDVLVTATDAWKGLLALDVYSVTSASLDTRSTTTLTVLFGLPAQTGTATNGLASGFVTLQLPYQWGCVFQTSANVGSATLSVMSNTTGTSVGSTVAYWTGRSVTVSLDSGKNWTEGSNYTLVLNSVPTPQSAFDTNLGSFVLSLGTTTTGSYAWSNSQTTAAATPVMALKSTLNELSYSSTSLTVHRGSYSASVCIKPASGNFKGDSTYTIDGSTFKTYPTTLKAVQGQASVCGVLGTAITTTKTYYWVTFTKVETTTQYTALPYLMVLVDGTANTWTVPTAASCTFGGNSIPIVLTVPAAPYTDVTMKLVVKTYTSPAANPSENITVPTTTLTFNTAKSYGTLSFSCGASLSTTTTPLISYTKAGTDSAAYTLSGADITVTGAAKGTQATTPTVTLTMDTTNSVPATTQLTANCGDGVGTGYVWFAPEGTDTPTSDQTSVETAYTAYAVTQNTEGYDATVAYKGAQWAQFTVLDKTVKYNVGLGSISLGSYVAMLYCVTTDPFFYALTTKLAVTAKDNGGRTTKVALTFGKAIDDITNNADVLSILCVVSTNLGLAPAYVQDAYGGYCGKPSPYLPAPAVTTNTTNSSRILATSWTVNMFIQPDPTAATVSNAGYQALVEGIQTQINAVTSAKYGSVLSVTSTSADAITEAAVAWGTSPTATVATNYLTTAVAGSTNVTAYIYLAWQTTGTAISTSTTTTTTTTTNTSNSTSTATTSLNDWSGTTFSAAHTFYRATTTATALTFSFTVTTNVTKEYAYYVQGTSLNPDPVSAKYKTTYISGSQKVECATTDKTTAGCSSTGSKAILSSVLFVMISLIVSFLY